jgi:hypothetical protein
MTHRMGSGLARSASVQSGLEAAHIPVIVEEHGHAYVAEAQRVWALLEPFFA